MKKQTISSLRPRSVLFVCSLNAIRSPIAEALMRKLHPEIYVASAGIKKGEHDAFAQSVIQEIGVDFNYHNPRKLEDIHDGFFDIIIALTAPARQAVLQKMQGYSVDIEFWPTPDPTIIKGSREQILDAYRQVRETLQNKITERFLDRSVLNSH